MSGKQFVFSRSAIFDRNRIYVLSYAKDEQSTRASHWTGQWDNYAMNFSARCIATVDQPSPEIVAMSALGEVHVASPSGQAIEIIDTTDESPQHRGELRCIRNIEGNLYACGMGRQVYRRVSTNNWIRLDAGVLDPLGSGNVVGFESIDGFTSSELYASGASGEIWCRHSEKWFLQASPTNKTLHKVLCAPDGHVYIGGRSGVIVKGHKDSWRSINHDVTKDTITDMAWFQDELYVATEENLYKLNQEVLHKVSFNLEHTPSCRYLDSKDGILCSTGPRDIVIFDGTNWSALPPLS